MVSSTCIQLFVYFCLFFDFINCADPCPIDKDWTSKPFEPFRLKWFIRNLPDFTPERQEVIKACDQKPHEGVPDADFLLYVGQPSNCGAGLLANANHCGRESFDGRPLFGYVNLCPGSLDTGIWSRSTLHATIQHEMLHALGFSNAGLGDIKYKDENGTQREGKRQITRVWRINSNTTIEHTSWFIVTPKVKEFVRQHFNCADLEGAELENEGGSGTAEVHWEQRIFGTETMTGYVRRISYVSEVTLKFFEDTNWYKYNASYAETFSFAKNLGCIFAKQSCYEYTESLKDGHLPAKAKPYCNWADYVQKSKYKAAFRECNSDRAYYARCDWNNPETDTFEPNKQYFSDKSAMVNGKLVTGKNVYGYASSTDGCPQWTEYTYGADTRAKVGDSVCEHGNSQPKAQGNWGAELFGDDSKCFQLDGRFEVYDCGFAGWHRYDAESAYGAGCYKYKCEFGRLMVLANYSIHDGNASYRKQYKICWSKGSVVQIQRLQDSGKYFQSRFHKGSIICPACSELCENNPRWDEGNFKCGPDISINVTDKSPACSDQSNPITPSGLCKLVYMLVPIIIMIL